MSVKPLTPAETISQPPDFVVEEVNRLLCSRFDGISATIKLGEIRDAVLSRVDFKNLHTAFNSRWLNIETLYRANGWNVHYDKPGYDESYESFFVFSPR